VHPQLTSVIQELDEARDRLRALAESIDDADWNSRADPDRWSVAECVAHLNLTTEAFLPLIDEALGRAYARGSGLRRRMRRSLIGWMIWRSMGPRARFKSKTPARFVPRGDFARAELVEQFGRLTDELGVRIRTADGYPIDRVRFTSPFDRRVKYDVYSALTILARHQHRHLWQAEQVREALRTELARRSAQGATVAR